MDLSPHRHRHHYRTGRSAQAGPCSRWQDCTIATWPAGLPPPGQQVLSSHTGDSMASEASASYPARDAGQDGLRIPGRPSTGSAKPADFGTARPAAGSTYRHWAPSEPLVSQGAGQKAAADDRRAWRVLRHPLTIICALQTALSLTLVWSNTAFTDEADYLWIGHLVLRHWVHGTSWPAGMPKKLCSVRRSSTR